MPQQPVPELFPVPPATDTTGDLAFMEEIQHMLQNRQSEAAIRNRFKDWLWRFIRKAASYEEMAYGETNIGINSDEEFVLAGHGFVWADESTKLKELSASQFRFEGWREGVSYHYLAKDGATIFSTEVVKTLDVFHQVDRLRILKGLSHDDSARIYLALYSEIQTYDQINLLLSAVPLNQGGLAPLALGLFHPYKKVRFAVADLLERINEHMAGQHFTSALNRFQTICFEQVLAEQDRENGINGTKIPEKSSNDYGSIIKGLEDIVF